MSGDMDAGARARRPFACMAGIPLRSVVALIALGLCMIPMGIAADALHGLYASDGLHPQDLQAMANMGLALTGGGGALIALGVVAGSNVLVSRLALRCWR